MWKCIGFNCHAIYTFFPHVMEVLIKLIWATQLWLLSFVIKPIWRVNFAIFFRQKEKKKCSTHFPAWAIINSLFSMVFFLSSLCKNSPTARKKKKKNTKEVLKPGLVAILRFYTLQIDFFFPWNCKQTVYSNLSNSYLKNPCTYLPVE